MYYLVVIGYESDNLDRNGNPRIAKEKYAVQAESVEEVSVVMAKYCAGDTRNSEILSIVKMPIECVIDNKNTPEYFK